MSEIDPRSLRFEPLRATHIPRILEIEKDSNSAPWSEKSFQNELENKQSVFLVAMSGNKIVGYGGLWLCIDEAHITTLAVAPDARRNGIGKAIMVQLLSRAQEQGMVCSTLEVRAGNEAAIELYRDIGYRETSHRRAYYPDNKEDAVVMWMHRLQEWKPAA